MTINSKNWVKNKIEAWNRVERQRNEYFNRKIMTGKVRTVKNE